MGMKMLRITIKKVRKQSLKDSKQKVAGLSLTRVGSWRTPPVEPDVDRGRLGSEDRGMG